MFQIKLHTKRKSAHSPSWGDHFVNSATKKRVVNKGHTTAYEPKTLAESVHSACMKSFGFSGEAETTALQVVKDIEAWLHDKEEVTLADIKRHAAAALHKYNPRAAYEYLPVKEYEIHEDEYGFIRL